MLANREMEQINSEALKALQFERLHKTLEWAYSKSSFYRNKFDESECAPQQLESLTDIEKFPFTMSKELQQVSAMDLLTLPLSGVARISLWEHPQPTVHMYTINDIAANVEMTSRVLTAAGISRASIVGLLGDMADSGLFDAQQALEAIGAAAVPLSTDYERTLKLLEAAHVDTIIGSARRILRLVIQLQASGLEISNFPLHKILCLNETLQNPLKMHLEKRTGTEVYDLFSSAEFGCIGMFFQCEGHVGQHIQQDYFYPEIVAFGGNEVIHEFNCMGELVLTTLTAEAMPLIRYRTGQAVMITDEPCNCGRTFARIITPMSNF